MNTILKLTLGTALTFALTATSASAGMLDGWSGEAGLSGSKTSGNTETTDVGVGLNLNKEADIWTHKFDLNYDFGEVSSVESKNRTYLGYQLDRQFNERLYGYGNANYFSDEFGAYESGYFVGAGLGYNLFVNEPGLWDIEGGIGYRLQELRDIVGTVTPDAEGEFALRGASEFDYAFNDSVSFYNDSEVIWSESDTYAWNDIGISAQLAGNLSAKFGVRVDHHTDVPVGTENTDTITRGTLVYSIN